MIHMQCMQHVYVYMTRVQTDDYYNIFYHHINNFELRNTIFFCDNYVATVICYDSIVYFEYLGQMTCLSH